MVTSATFPDRLMVGQRTLTPLVLVRIQFGDLTLPTLLVVRKLALNQTIEVRSLGGHPSPNVDPDGGQHCRTLKQGSASSLLAGRHGMMETWTR